MHGFSCGSGKCKVFRRRRELMATLKRGMAVESRQPESKGIRHVFNVC